MPEHIEPPVTPVSMPPQTPVSMEEDEIPDTGPGDPGAHQQLTRSLSDENIEASGAKSLRLTDFEVRRTLGTRYIHFFLAYGFINSRHDPSKVPELLAKFF